MIVDLIKSGGVKTPWPTLIDGDKFSGDVIEEHIFCSKKCKEKQCLNFSQDMSESTCLLGLTYYQAKIQGKEFVVYGLIGNRESKFLKDKNFKRLSKGRNINYILFCSWIEKINKLVSVYKERENKIYSEALQPLHETIKWSGHIRTLTEKIYDKSEGSNDEDLKALYKSAVMLDDTFESLQIYFNPKSAAYGRKKDIDVYRLLDKLQKVINLTEDDKYIKSQGKIRRNYNLRETFKVLPYSLIQNAIKYSVEQQIKILLEENHSGLNVSVISYGPYITEDDMKKIFIRGYRGEYAKNYNRKGMGAGLYIAKQVALANDIEILVDSVKTGRKIESIPIARNTFSFFIPR